MKNALEALFRSQALRNDEYLELQKASTEALLKEGLEWCDGGNEDRLRFLQDMLSQRPYYQVRDALEGIYQKALVEDGLERTLLHMFGFQLGFTRLIDP